MAFCPTCGTQGDGAFCANCGTALPAGAARPGTGATPPPPPAQPVSSAGLETNVASALCYLVGLLTGVLFLVLEPYSRDRTVRFHAFQSIFMSLAWFVIYTVAMILTFALGSIPFIGGIVATLIYLALMLGGVGLWLFLMYKAYNNERYVLPVIGPLAEKQV